MLEEGASMTDTLRSPLCAIVLLSWHLVAVFVIETGDSDLVLCKTLLNSLTTAYPNVSRYITFFWSVVCLIFYIRLPKLL